MGTDALIDEYLGRLAAAAGRLSADRRAELVDEVREHIAAALAEAGRSDEVTVRNVLERLGQPEDIVAAEGEPDGPPPARTAAPSLGSPVARTPWSAGEVVAAVLLIVVALAVPLLGPLVLLGFVWVSDRFTRRQKLLATVVIVTLLELPVLGLFAVRSVPG